MSYALSFLKWNGLTTTKQFVGLANYVQVFTQDPVFWQAVRNTVLWTVLSVIFPPAIGFGLALALNQNIPGSQPAAGAVLHAGHHRADRRRDHVALDVRPVLRPVQRRADGARACRG